MPSPLPTHRMIEAFRTTVLRGSMSAAADALGMSQPSMSRVLAELESLVGFQLFAKHGRTVRPTEEALALMAKVQQSFLGLEDIARFYEQLRKQRIGRLSIVTIPALGHSVMPEAIAHLRRQHPDVVVSLHIASSIDVAHRVRNRQADIGFAAQGVALGEVEAVADFVDGCVCIAPAGGFPPSLERVDLQAMAGRPFVALTGTLQKRLDAMMRAQNIDLDIRAEVSQSLSASELVLRGSGISVVDPFTGAMHCQRGGIALPLEPGLPYKVQAMAMSDTRLSLPAKSLLGFLKALQSNLKTHVGGE
jgi:DNA-binding transcriptional LysR family regulator